MNIINSVFSTEGFLRPQTQVRRFGRKLKALDDFFAYNFDANLQKIGLSAPLTRWVPYDGYIRHQNDHLSGRMTDISVMGEWQVAGVGGIRPLERVLGEALEGRFSFEARNYLFSFQRYDLFEEFFCFPCFWKIWRQTFKLWGCWFRRCLGGLFEHSAPSPGIFFANCDYDHE